MNDSRQKIEVNLKEDTTTRQDCVTAVPDVIEPKLSDITKSERVPVYTSHQGGYERVL